MSKKLRLRLLGKPKIETAGVDVTDPLPGKAQAILYYLTVTGRPQRRSTLAGLLWGRMEASGGRSNLRKALSSLRQTLNPFLEIDRETVAFAPEAKVWVDVVTFEQALTDEANLGALQAAVDLYRGDLLAGFHIRQAAAFEDWLVTERERLRELMIEGLERLTDLYAAQDSLTEGLDTARRLLTLEPWRESGHRQMMSLLVRDGQRSAALTQFETCREILADELGVEPDAETVALYERIRQGDIERDEASTNLPWPTGPFPVSRSTVPHNLPLQSTPFVGRASEVATIVERLTDPACRLLTLVGPGGIGKTRLALQAAYTLTQPADIALRHGILFVPLTPVHSTSGLLAAIAQAATFSFYGNVRFRQQLLDYLREKSLLLVLDNFEQLLPVENGGPDNLKLLTDILAVAPAVKILATSREPLSHPQAEQHRIGGLSFPTETELGLVSTPPELYDAVQLFAQSARRIEMDFSLTATLPQVIRICQLVEGMPLGLELAAAWLRLLPPAKIVEEIERSLDLLSTQMRNVPERQRSIRAVFEYTWERLPTEAQTVLKRLSLFRGGFQQAAAEVVAGATVSTLNNLVDTSLLRLSEQGRYYLHELLRQFAADKLEADQADLTAAREAHSGYYLHFLTQRTAALKGVAQQAALREIGPEIENIQAGWRWVVAHHHFVAIEQALAGLYDFYQIRSRYQEGREVLAPTLDTLDRLHPRTVDLNRLWVKVMIRYGAFCHFLGDEEIAQEFLENGLLQAWALDLPAEAALALNILGQIAGWQGHRAEAQQHLSDSLTLSRAADDRDGTANTLHKLAQVKASFGTYAQAKRLAEESLALSRDLGRPDWRAYALDVLGWATFCLGQYAETEAYYRESLALFEESGDQLGLALALGGIGSVAWAVGGARLAEAHDYLERSLVLCREIGHRHHISSRLWYLAQIANDKEEHQAAQQYSREGLAIAEAIDSAVFTAYNLCALGVAAFGLDDFSAADYHLHRALHLALEAQQLPPLTIGLLALAAVWLPRHETMDDSQMTHLLMALQVVGHDPACWEIFKQRATELERRWGAVASPEIIDAARQRSQALTLPDCAEIIISL